MAYSLRLEQFEGPLDLLLQLIEDQQLDITTISLATVTDQYLAYIEKEDQLPPDEVADFLVVAAKLIYLKSKYLLPNMDLEEEEGVDLETQLKVYREYFQASKNLAILIGKKRWAFARMTPLKMEKRISFSPPPYLTASDLPSFFEFVVGRIQKVLQLPRIVLKATVSIREKITALKEAIERGVLAFSRFYDGSNKQDVIISFLAVLELVKMRTVDVQQTQLFADILISKRNLS